MLKCFENRTVNYKKFKSGGGDVFFFFQEATDSSIEPVVAPFFCSVCKVKKVCNVLKCGDQKMEKRMRRALPL